MGFGSSVERRSCAESQMLRPRGMGKGLSAASEQDGSSEEEKREKNAGSEGPGQEKAALRCRQGIGSRVALSLTHGEMLGDLRDHGPRSHNAWVAAGGAALRVPEHGEGAGGC